MKHGKTIIKDSEKNVYELNDKFSFDITKEIIKSKKSIITDQNGNKYEFEDLVINMKITVPMVSPIIVIQIVLKVLIILKIIVLILC